MAERDPVPFDANAFRARLRAATSARVALARTGVSISTADQLAFQLAQAQARDAVHERLDVGALRVQLEQRSLEVIHVTSRAGNRQTYLARPDWGRRLDEPSCAALSGSGRSDLAIVLADGLSARAVASHAVPLLDQLLPRLAVADLRLASLVVAEQGRVAIGDEIGALLRAALVCVLIGERPGLTSPDSLGAYLTWAPAVGRTDAQRNCLSNIRPGGLSYADAASRLFWLIAEARRRETTGVALKDNSSEALTASPPQQLTD